MRFKIFSATRFQRAASPGIGVLIIALWSLGCGGSASRGPDSGGDAQPAADPYAKGTVEAVRDYLDALDEGDYARAYAHWSHDDMTFDEFKRQRANIKAVQADIGKPRFVRQHRPRGAVGGGHFYRIPVELQITYKDDSRECAKGTYELWSAGSPLPSGVARWFIASSNIKEC